MRRLISLVGLAIPILALDVCAPTKLLAQDAGTSEAFWPKLSVRYQWPSSLSQTVYSQFKTDAGSQSTQWSAGTDLDLQAKRFARPHLVNIDPSKEHVLVLGIGYEYLDTQGGASPKYENRLKAQATGRHRVGEAVLIEDRNRFEFRWVNGGYSSRYRNRLRVEVDLHQESFRYSPYVSAEVFYSWATNSWNEQQYTVGIQWPHRQLWVLDTYYLRQNCSTCSPQHLNVAGVSLGLFLGARR